MLRLLVGHGWLLLFGGLARWRLETFGLYMPSLPQARPWWRVNGRAGRAILRQRRAYAYWLLEMDTLRRQGAEGWWRLRLGPEHKALQAYMTAANAVSENGD